jgi:hypothetical protein
MIFSCIFSFEDFLWRRQGIFPSKIIFPFFELIELPVEERVADTREPDTQEDEDESHPVDDPRAVCITDTCTQEQ